MTVKNCNGMAVLRGAVLGIDVLSLLAVVLIRFLLPVNSGQDGEALFWTGLLLTYLLILLVGTTLVLNLIYLMALAFTRGRYHNVYGRLSRALLVLVPVATVLGLTVR